MAGETQNYTLGRGEVRFARFKPGTQVPESFRYIGNTPEFNLTIESTTLDHFSSDRGIREKDDSVPLEVTRSGSMTTDNIDTENVALFFFGDAATITQVGSTGHSEDFDSVSPGHAYKLGQTIANPVGYSGLAQYGFGVGLQGASLVAAVGTITVSSTGPVEGDTFEIGGRVYTFRAVPSAPYDIDINVTPATQATNIAAAINAGAGAGTVYGTGTVAHPDVSAGASSAVVTVTALTLGTAGNAISLSESATNVAASGAALAGGTGVSYIEGTDFEVNYDSGFVTPLVGGAITEGTDITVFYGVRTSTRDQVISGSTPVEGALMYTAFNPKGPKIDYYMPWIKVTPNGDYALKGDDWQTIPFNLEILKRSNAEAIYANGQPAYA